jgi:hypothetical protein
VGQGDLVLLDVAQRPVIRKQGEQLRADAADETAINGDADQGRGDALGHRALVLDGVPVEGDVGLVQRVGGLQVELSSREVLLEHQAPLTHHQHAVDAVVLATPQVVHHGHERSRIHPRVCE